MAPVTNTGIDQDPPDQAGHQASQTRLQGAVEERDVDFKPGHDHDVGTAEEDFSPEFHKMMDKPLDERVQPQEGNLGEGKGGPDDEPVKPPEDVIEILEPKSAHKLWPVGPDGALSYIQRPMSFIQKMQWFALVGVMIDNSMSGDNPLSLADLFDSPTAKAAAKAGRGVKIEIKDMKEADTFVRALGKVIQHSPDFLLDSYLIWLSVPSHERAMVKEIFEMHEDEGGLSDETGMEMIEVFVDQNWDALTSFFSERIGGIQRRVASKQELKRRATIA